MSRPIGTEISPAMAVISSVPTIACRAPPPASMTLRIEEEKNSGSKRASPFETTV
ncbi:hypothetical protein ACH61_02049 [Rathayibacter tanaceti]|uniref:Uncharacterized protein n=1 Tax=Rathayibacter tanaceti TaxID=1671680 RepID=A0A166HM59_9MICO|nr:hypothetical protein ACH61_02049 [Rathayibacter tanaceti]